MDDRLAALMGLQETGRGTMMVKHGALRKHDLVNHRHPYISQGYSTCKEYLNQMYFHKTHVALLGVEYVFSPCII